MDCLFCQLATKKINAKIEFEDDELIAFHDINPQAPIHVLIIPKKHITTINETSSDDVTLIGKMVLRAKAITAKLGVSDAGYRLVFNVNKDGGQEIYHIHLHILAGRQMMWPPG